MASTQYQIYRDAVIGLAKTLVIKNAAVADAINNALLQLYNAGMGPAYAVDLYDPTGWKYYLNLAGQYHPTDTPMTVISQDTLERIDFTVANLKVHTATAEAYRVGTRYYADLLANYPTQELLIRGILNPVEYATAEAAEDGEILWYDASLVEANEMNLISELATWIKLYHRRWFNAAFCNTDELYLAAHLHQMYCHLPAIILAIRLKYCHTHQAHIFHIREYLAGQGGLDIFVDYLTKAQQLWLYRNIRYIQRNAGMQKTFQWLVDNILTPRGIPLSSWTMRHNTHDTQTNLTNTVEFVRGDVNSSKGDTGAQVRDVTQMLTAEVNVAKGNTVEADHVSEVTLEMARSMSDSLNTKVLESSLLDLTDASPYRLADCLVNHWLYFASIGQYLSVVSVENPTTGEVYTFNAADAFVIYVYCMSASIGLPLDTIPLLYANKVRKLVTPTRAELKALVDMNIVADEDIEAVYTGLPTLARTYLSIESFNTMAQAIHAAELYQHALFSTQGHRWTRAYLEQATLYLYQDVKCDLGQGQNYAAWFKAKGLSIPSMNTEDMATVANNILVTATGQNLATVTNLADLQSAMLSLMARLSSYSVQYLASINTSPIIVLERPGTRAGDIDAMAEHVEEVTPPYSELEDLLATGAAVFKDLVPLDVSAYDLQASTEVDTTVDLTVRLQDDVKTITSNWIPLTPIGIRAVTDNLDYSIGEGLITTVEDYQPAGLKSLPEAFTGLGLGFYGPLSDADKQTLADRYTAYLQTHGVPVAPLSQAVATTRLGIFDIGVYAPFIEDRLTVLDLRPFISKD